VLWTEGRWSVGGAPRAEAVGQLKFSPLPSQLGETAFAPVPGPVTMNPVGRGSCRAGSKWGVRRLGRSLSLPSAGSWRAAWSCWTCSGALNRRCRGRGRPRPGSWEEERRVGSRGRWRRAVVTAALVVAVGLLPGLGSASRADETSAALDGVSYTNQVLQKVPWSVHLVRVSRTNAAYELQTAHANGGALGLTKVADQVRQFDPRAGAVVAAVNGGFYQRDKLHAGDPRGLQIVGGELISAPDGGVAFWVGADGEPRIEAVEANFEVVWSDGSRAPFGLNGPRQEERPELYTPALGASTRTKGGRELVLERGDRGNWLPLQASVRCVARVREVRDDGDSPLTSDTMVLSLSPRLAARLTSPKSGSLLQLLTVTSPSLAGVKAAMGGGPILVRGGRRHRIVPPPVESYEFTSMLERHPRTAMGWTRDEYLLVVVDGRQRDLSAGMTLDELARYLISLGCLEAMNLDGGGSSTLWFDAKVRNSPCDGYERTVANSVLVVRRKAEPRSGPASRPE